MLHQTEDDWNRLQTQLLFTVQSWIRCCCLWKPKIITFVCSFVQVRAWQVILGTTQKQADSTTFFFFFLKNLNFFLIFVVVIFNEQNSTTNCDWVVVIVWCLETTKNDFCLVLMDELTNTFFSSHKTKKTTKENSCFSSKPKIYSQKCVFVFTLVCFVVTRNDLVSEFGDSLSLNWKKKIVFHSILTISFVC